MIEAKAGSQVQILSFEGYPICKARLTGIFWDSVFNRWLYVVLPMETRKGYEAGTEDTAHRVMPCAAVRWLEKGMRFAPRPYKVATDLPIIK